MLFTALGDCECNLYRRYILIIKHAPVIGDEFHPGSPFCPWLSLVAWGGSGGGRDRDFNTPPSRSPLAVRVPAKLLSVHELHQCGCGDHDGPGERDGNQRLDYDHSNMISHWHPRPASASTIATGQCCGAATARPRCESAPAASPAARRATKASGNLGSSVDVAFALAESGWGIVVRALAADLRRSPCGRNYSDWDVHGHNSWRFLPELGIRKCGVTPFPRQAGSCVLHRFYSLYFRLRPHIPREKRIR